MHVSSSLHITALGLAFSSAVFAQSSAPTPPTPPAVPSSGRSAFLPTLQLPVITESSRIRAFNAGPGGEVRSLYLQNGSVVNLAPALSGQVGPAIRKGEKITVTGTKWLSNGQALVEAASVELSGQTFSMNVASASPDPATLAEASVPPPVDVPLAPLPPPQRRNKAAASAPCGVSTEAPPPPPDFGGPPPPPPAGMVPLPPLD